MLARICLICFCRAWKISIGTNLDDCRFRYANTNVDTPLRWLLHRQFYIPNCLPSTCAATIMEACRNCVFRSRDSIPRVGVVQDSAMAPFLTPGLTIGRKILEINFPEMDWQRAKKPCVSLRGLASSSRRPSLKNQSHGCLFARPSKKRTAHFCAPWGKKIAMR